MLIFGKNDLNWYKFLMNKVKQGIKAFQLTKSMRTLAHNKSEVKQKKAQEFIHKFLEEEGGLFLKVAQYLGTQNQKIESASYQLERKLIPDIDVQAHWEKRFPETKLFLKKEVYSASIGQVNRAKIDGKDVALKIRLPGIREDIKKQL